MLFAFDPPEQMRLAGEAAVAVILGSVGIHGLIATSVTERTREIGIRLALGATRGTAVRTLALPGVVALEQR